jgi:two-component system sensor histidine kinase/response regulator
MPTPVTDARLFELIEDVPAGIIVVDARGSIIYSNAAWKQLFGIEVTEELSRTPIADIDVRIAGTDTPYPRERRPISRALLGEASRVSDIEVHFGGTIAVLDIEARPIRNAEGSVAFAIASVTDITAQVRAEEAYRGLFENAPIGIYRSSPQGHIILANPALLQMLGFDSFEAFAQAGGLNAVDDRRAIRKLLDQNREVRALEATWRRNDGTYIQVSENARVILGPDHRYLYFEGTVEDVSARKDMERELRRSREQYRHLIESASDIIYRCDAYGIFRYVNATVLKILGFEERELVGTHFTELIDPEYRAAAQTFYLKQFAEKTPNTYYEFPVVAKNGDRIWIGQNVQPIVTGEWVLGFQAVARDISERKEMESALARARDTAIESARVKSEFLANMSHEIRTPLNGVVGMSDLLLRMSLTGEQREAANTIRTSAEALLSLVDDILDLSKIEAGKLTISHTDFDLDELIDGVTDMFAERAAAKGIKLRAVIYPDVHRHLLGDSLRVRQVLINLVGNAVKFTEAGEVSLSVMVGETQQEAGGENVSLWFLVNDTGIGITEENQARLFMPFMQADGSMTRRFGGTGLGLAISKQLVDMMGGRIGVASVAGEGSTFWFTANFSKDLRPELEVKAGALAGARAVIIDSHPINRLMLRRHLTSSGMHVEEAAPEQAIQQVKDARADVIVVEMQLEETDGISVIREIREDSALKAIPVVLVTSIGRRKSDVEFFQAEHIDMWVIKPVRRAQLAAAVAQVIRRGDDTTAAPTAEVNPPQKRILVVEDNVINQKVAGGQLRLLGYDPDIVASGTAAIEFMRHHRYDLILLDCQMPEMDGYEVASAIRRMENNTRRVPIVAMTAHAAQGERDRCIASGMDDFMTKPVSMQRLGEVLSRWLGHRESDVIDQGKIAGLQLLGRANPTFMSDITGLFKEDSLMRLHELRGAVAKGDADALMRAAHALKSSSGNIGATRMYSMAAMLEANAKKGEVDTAAAIVEQLAEELDRAMEALTG